MVRKHEDDAGLVDMDRLSRIFTWLTAVIVTFMLGMVFDQVIFADSSQLVSFAQTGVPFTVSYPAGWSAALDRSHDLVSKNASTVAADSELMLVLNDSPITQVTSLGEGYLVTIAKIRSDATDTYNRYVGTPGDGTTTPVTIEGTTTAVQLPAVTTNVGTMEEVVMSVDKDIYVMDLVTKRGSTDTADDVATVLASLKFSK